MSNKITEELIVRAKNIKLLLMDCDGVLTDGRLYFTEKGEEIKVFHVRDGQGIATWHQAGFSSGIISGRKSKIIFTRATELGMHYIKVDSFNKRKDFDDIIRDKKISNEEVAFIGDDIADICIMQNVGFSVTVADGAIEVVPFVNYITDTKGGFGAVREVIDLLLSLKLM